MWYCWDFEKFADMEKKKFLVRNKREITLKLAFIKDILINFEKKSAPQKFMKLKYCDNNEMISTYISSSAYDWWVILHTHMKWLFLGQENSLILDFLCKFQIISRQQPSVRRPRPSEPENADIQYFTSAPSSWFHEIKDRRDCWNSCTYLSTNCFFDCKYRLKKWNISLNFEYSIECDCNILKSFF